MRKGSKWRRQPLSTLSKIDQDLPLKKLKREAIASRSLLRNESLSGSGHFWVECVAQSIAEQIESQNQEHDGNTREKHHPG